MDNKQTRLEYVNAKLELFKKAEEQRHKLLHARLDAENASVELRDIESQIMALHDAYIKQIDEPTADNWHPASEKPEHTEGWFLALTKDNLPFLTHYINGWLPQVHMWKYIDIPMAPL